jgi:hypothetical protein
MQATDGAMQATEGSAAPPVVRRARRESEMLLATPRGDVVIDALSPAPRIRTLRGGYLCATWSKPGRLDADSREQLYQAVTELCNSTFDVDFCPYWQERERGDYFGSLACFSLFLTQDRRIIGFTSYQTRSFRGHPCIYIDSTSILPRYQRAGLLRSHCVRAFVATRLRHPHRRTYMVVRTENPAVYRGFALGLGADAIYPRPGAPPPQRIREIGTAVAEWLGQGDKFHARDLRIESAYETPLYSVLPESGDPALDRFFTQTLDGVDAFLVIAPLRALRRAGYLVRHQVARPVSRALARRSPRRRATRAGSRSVSA